VLNSSISIVNGTECVNSRYLLVPDLLINLNLVHRR